MLKLYTYLYAWNCLRDRRLWGKGYNDRFDSLISVAGLMMLNVDTVIGWVFLSCRDCTWLRENLKVAGIASALVTFAVCWWGIYRTGVGMRLAEEINRQGLVAVKRGERLLLLFVIASVVVPFASFALMVLFRR